MNYPLLTEYREAILMAEDCFEELKDLRPVRDASGNLVMSSGNFAAVFKMQDPSGKNFAVKCFLKEQAGREESYPLIAEALEYVSSPYLLTTKYLSKEIFVDTKDSTDEEFPVLLMDWVEGVTLDRYVLNNLTDPNVLHLLVYQFAKMAAWLLAQDFAHGDLKPDNILVKEDGSLVLVDYDGMYVPAMRGQKARELGSPDFRHPLRTESVFNEHIDDFSLMTILLSLKAIALHPDALQQYGAADRLLLSATDYADLSKSQFLQDLFPSTDAELNQLYGMFLIAHSQQNLAFVSFRLLNLKKPRLVEVEVLSTKV
ncbi:MAG: protein kinase domain-containing protein, partial [Mangrovibacterium sp.]